MNTPLFSVVMPAYNAERYVGQAIESVLAQTMPSWELLIVNDCSKDRTLETCQTYQDPRLRIFSTPKNLNASGARNLALDHAKGKFVAFLDSDDMAVPDRLERQLRAFQADPNLGVLGSQVEFFSESIEFQKKSWIYPEQDAEIKAAMLFNCPFLISTMTIRAELLKKLEPPVFFPEFAPCEDYHFGVRLLGLCKFFNDPLPFSRYRLHPCQLNVVDAGPMAEQYRRVHRALLEQLGVDVSDSNVETHQLCARGGALTGEQLNVAEEWLEAILEANFKTELIPHAGIRSFLGIKWFKLCKQQPEKNLRLFSRYRQSKLSSFFLSRRQKIQFFMECLLHS